jgi:acetyl-CoA carboxylase biotin carboxylase subunit
LRKKIVESAVKMAKAVGYLNAGTVEFLVEGENFYFLEVNARLQVEHPITERVTGIDLVKKQFLVAWGERLDIEQENIKRLGHAFEFRIYAEDPFNNFAPSPGFIRDIKLPGGFGVRVDSGVYPGYEVPIYYDPILMKVIIWDETREKAIVKAKRALSELQISGIQTNIPFHFWLLEQPAFISGNYWTRFIDETFKGLEEKEEIEKFVIAAIIKYLEETERKKVIPETTSPLSKWKLAGRMEVVKRL